MSSLVMYVHLTLFRFGLWLTGGAQVKFIRFLHGKNVELGERWMRGRLR